MIKQIDKPLNRFEDLIDKLRSYEKRGVSGHISSSVHFNPELSMYVIERCSSDYDDGYVGECDDHKYYIPKEDFIPILQNLKSFNESVIDTDGIVVNYFGTYDHNYDHIDEYNATIQKANIHGKISLKSKELELSLGFSPISAQISSNESTGDLSEFIKAWVLRLK